MGVRIYLQRWWVDEKWNLVKGGVGVGLRGGESLSLKMFGVLDFNSQYEDDVCMSLLSTIYMICLVS